MSEVEKEKLLLKDYIPKEATQQSKFLEKYPEYDGRGLVIAVVDTGIDLSFDGMQKTTTGLPKVIDCFDFTGAGHVDTSCVKEADSNNNLIGLSGRLLKIPESWKNPSGQWHLGLKSIYEMCSGAALESIIKKRKEFISCQNDALKIVIDQKMGQKKDNENYKSMIEYLTKTEDLSTDSLVADCIVWFNGENWQACLDTSFIGDLENVKVLTNYNDGHEYDTFWNIISYGIKINDNGNLLEIIFDYQGHGTTVAHVAAACFPEAPERNGLAPGAQIISMTVLDSRKDNCLNYHALKIAFEKCIELKVDIINCSFRCASKHYETLIKEMTEKHGIIIVHGIGNSGPVYSSTDRDIFLFQNIFLIGSLVAKKEEGNYKVAQYSSRGPNLFGDQSVSFVAPGYATFTLPDYYPEKIKMFQGTSLAAPNAAGSIACLISALKNNSFKYSPTIIKFALSKTALLPPNGNVLAFGHGIIQIMAAFEFIKSSGFLKKLRNCNFKVKLSNEEKSGIFLKVDGKDFNKNKENYSIEILNQKRTDKISLKLTPDAEKFIQYSSDPQSPSFKVKIDPSKLKPGTINYAEVHGYNSKNLSLGSIFHLPITVIIPQKITKEQNYRIQKDITIKPKTSYQFFILPPKKSYQCTVKVTVLEETTLTHLYLQYAVEDYYVGKKNTKVLKFDAENKTQTHCIEIYWNRIHEFSLSASDSMKNSTKVQVEINFFGIYQDPQKLEENVIIKKEENFNVFKFGNYLETIKTSLSMNFEKVSYILMPEDICKKTIKHPYEPNPTEYFKLTFTFTITKETKCYFEMKHTNARLLAQLFTESKKFIYSFYSIYEKPLTLSPGKYSIITFFTPSINDTLFDMKDLPSITVTMEFYEPFKFAISNPSATKNGKETNEKMFEFKNGEHQIFFGNIPTKNMPQPLPKTVTFHGSMNFCNEKTQLKVPFEHKYTFHNQNENFVKKTEKENIAQNIYDKQWPSLNDSCKLLKKKSKKKVIRNEKEALKFKENLGTELTDIVSTNGDNKSTSNKIGKTKINNITKAQEYIAKVCDYFAKNADNQNIQKELTQIKQAIASKHFGTALLYLNKISTENQTNPTSKFIELAIIELLKHLKWVHLVEAHQHAMLDRHRDYYRLF